MKKYQVRPSEIATSAWNRGYLKPLELLRIAAWKTGQGLGSLTVNTEHDIESRTGASMDCIQHWKGQRVVGLADQALWDDWRETARRAIGVAATRKGLLGLEGVDYPVATAILDVLDPDVWPVIDQWAVRLGSEHCPDGPLIEYTPHVGVKDVQHRGCHRIVDALQPEQALAGGGNSDRATGSLAPVVP